MESHLEETVFGIVALAAAGAEEIAAPGCALAIVVLGYRESRAATAGDEEHAERLTCLNGTGRCPGRRGAKARRPFGKLRAGFRDSRRDTGATLRVAARLHYSSTVAYELFLRRFACRTFLRMRKNLGVISTNSSSAMNSMAC